MNSEPDEVEEPARSSVLAGRDLVELFRPRRETKALLDELRRNPATREILDRGRESRASTADDADRSSRPRPRPATARPIAEEAAVLLLVVDYANGMTQEEIARKHGLHVQTVRKRLKAAGVVTGTRGSVLTEQELGEARGLLDAGLSAREVGRRLGVAHTTLLRAIRRADSVATPENHHRAPQDE